MQPRGAGAIAHAVTAWQATDDRDEATRDQLLRYWIEAEALRLTVIRAGEARTQRHAGSRGLDRQAALGRPQQVGHSFAIDLLGADGMTHPAGYEFVRPDESASRSDDPRKAYLRAKANSIEGGTSEIMKNILGERVLGLPGEPRVDKNIPWRDVPRS